MSLGMRRLAQEITHSGDWVTPHLNRRGVV